MEKRYNQLKKEQYVTQLAEAGKLEKAKAIIIQDEYSPIFKPIELHPETEVTSNEINDLFADVGVDLDIVSSDISLAAEDFGKLLDTTRTKLSNIKKVLRTEKERLEDINILCNTYTEFTDVILLSDSNVETDMDYEDKVFSLKSENSRTITYEVTGISGNGYEGNNYVFNNNKFASNISNTAKRDYISDDSRITYYEYSRITASNTEKQVFPLVNFDSITARCSVLMKGSEPFNTLEFYSEMNDVILESISTSYDGINFTQSKLVDVPLCDSESRFNKDDYIYGSGILSFPNCAYVKLVLKTSKNTNDSIAFTKKNQNGTEDVIELGSAKRSAIKINNITLSNKKYSNKGKITFNDFIKEPVPSIAIFANEYMTDGYEARNYITYTLTINGIDYKMTPINSQDNGKKILRITNQTIPADNVHYVSETIKSASLTINAKTPKDTVTPYISDLKILIGGE